jgi:uncharacterized NAD(P)/FAD-binding protein YdhS
MRANTAIHPTPRTVAIVGAGFCGTAVATNLLRMTDERLRVVLIDAAQIGRGLAYRPSRYPYLLNVPAARMSASIAEPLQFLEFARRRCPGAAAGDFLPRALYGDYLEWTLRTAESNPRARSELQRVHGRVVALEHIHRTTRSRIYLADGRTLDADDVVLALGNPPPASLPVHESLRGSALHVANPWQSPPVFRADERVLIVGTGLTMADVVLAGLPARRGTLVIHAISRHGLLPASQCGLHHGARPGADPAPLLCAASRSLLSLFRAVRRSCAAAETSQGNWREAIAFVRELAPSIWQRLAVAERRRFLRHVRPYWDIHRHRLAAGVAPILQGLVRNGQLQIHPARLLSLEPVGRQMRVALRPRGQRLPAHLLVDRVINCTGPNYDLANTRDPLPRCLLAQGTAVRDPLGLGLVTDEFGALVSSSGRATAGIYYVGPMLRATHWEATAVAELRHQAARLARHLVGARDKTDYGASRDEAGHQRIKRRAPSSFTSASAPPGTS